MSHHLPAVGTRRRRTLRLSSGWAISYGPVAIDLWRNQGEGENLVGERFVKAGAGSTRIDYFFAWPAGQGL